MLKIASLRAATAAFFGLGHAPKPKVAKHARSKYQPHTGAKEQERAKRFYMVDTHPSGAKRSAPTMQQRSARALRLVK
ncbi:hypothetical protein [Paraburkholderia azotifigens]|uniref:hypothetical protein n=1 Tax=Paraburkholderia azotifigens TaxID=2057004 RepID=UPI0038BADF10